MRNIIAAVAGGIFGTGLMISGMTDPRRTQGWLDIFGDWDPTLAFVMGGAIIPMAVAWALTKNRAPVLGGEFPAPPEPKLGRNLVLGSILFGVGWGMVGLCPGPAIASLSYGGPSVWIFTLSMFVGMMGAPQVRSRLDAMAQSA